MVKSIFDLESRIDFDTEYRRLMQIIDSHTFLYLGYSDCTFNELINEIFHLWPYRLTAINIFQYFELKGINWGVLCWNERR